MSDQPAAVIDLVDHLRTHALRTDGPFTLRSGEVSDWYLDARRTTFDGQGAVLVAAAVLSVLDPATEAVGGMTMGADPIAMATAIVGTSRGRSLTAFSIRKEPKGHGTGGRLVGPVGPGVKVTILEDTTTTGGALFEALDVAEAEGLVVVQAVSLVDRSGGAVARELGRRGIPYVGIVGPAELGVA